MGANQVVTAKVVSLSTLVAVTLWCGTWMDARTMEALKEAHALNAPPDLLHARCPGEIRRTSDNRIDF
jgi:hypothetical protein